MNTHNISEATIEFKLYSLSVISDEELKRKQCEYMEYLSPWILDYPWYNESFALNMFNSSQMRNFLFGRTNFGESIEDEWFIVWLLFQLTKSDPSIVIQVTDEDGEFLLIEAADELPKWLSPESASNRIWIHNGQLCIIQKDAPRNLSIDEAFGIFNSRLNNFSSSFFVSNKLQAAIDRRISGYPERIQNTKHRTHVKLSYMAATVLSLPGHACILRAALNAWANHHNDMIAVRQWRRQLKESSALFCQSTGTVKPRTEPLKAVRWPGLRRHTMDFVLRAFTLSRIQYAKLRSLPTPTGIQYPDNRGCSSTERIAIELGLKLCAGLDLLLAQANSVTSSPFSSVPLNYANGTDTEAWDCFVSRLTEVGYFRNELPGSRLFQQLTADAKEFFFVNVDSKQSTDLMKIRSPADRLVLLLDELEANPDRAPSINEFQVEEQSLPPADDESWLFITPDELDAMLSASTGQKMTTQNNNYDGNEPEAMADMLDKFVNAKSSFEGIEFGANKLGKRKCATNPSDPDGLTEDEESGDEVEEDQLVSEDSEDGFNEHRVEDSNGLSGADDSLNMYGMMRSLMSKIGDPFSFGIKDTKPDTSGQSNKANQPQKSTVSPPIHSNRIGDQLLSSDSSDDELLNLYAPNTDKHRDYGELSPSSSEIDSEELEPKGKCMMNPPWTVRNQSEKQTLRDVIPNAALLSAKPSTICDDSSDDEDEPRLSQVPWTSQSNTRKSISHNKKNGLALSTEFNEAMQSSSNTGSMVDYFAQMESELADQPANVGRLAALMNGDSLVRAACSRNKRGLSDRKKLRGNSNQVRLAQAEEFESEDSDDIGGDCNTEPQPSTSHSNTVVPISQMPGVSSHVMRNLYASVVPQGVERQQPTGPATHLFAALGIPVNQLASTGRPGERNPTSGT